MMNTYWDGGNWITMNTGKRMSNFQSVVNNIKSLKDLNHLNRLGGSGSGVVGLTENKPYGHTDQYNHDNINSLGYRGPEFNNNEILTLGCSQTWGTSLDEKYLWPRLLHDKTKKTYSNISTPGDSVQSQVIKAFYYFKEFGHPKKIIGIFPISRFEFPYISDVMTFKSLQPKPVFDYRDNPKIYFGDMYIPYELNEIQDKKTFTKTPHDLKDIFPIELALYYNNIFIIMLEQYCKSHNIDFIWSFWEAVDPILDNLLKEKYDGYFSFPLDIHNKMASSSDLKDEYFISLFNNYEKDVFFTNAPDGRHFGIGKHIFIADQIYSNEIWSKK